VGRNNSRRSDETECTRVKVLWLENDQFMINTLRFIAIGLGLAAALH